MSYSHNQKIIFWERTEDSLRSTEVTLGGHRLSKDDVARVANAYVMWALAMQDLLGNTRLTSDKSLRNWVTSLASRDLEEVMSTCKQVLACVRNWQSHTVIPGKDSFKHYLSEQGVEPGSDILRPLWPTLYGFATDFSNYRVINTLLQFIVRLTLKDVTWIEDENLRTYIEFEDYIKSVDYPVELLSQLNEVARDLFRSYEYNGYPHHGNGATSTTPKGAGIATKFHKFVNTWGTYQLQRHHDFGHPLIGDDVVNGNEVVTRITFVPKGIDKKRVVSAEPICNMFWQEALASCLDTMFQKDKRWHIDLHDQGHNQRLALHGSSSMDYATIDLSAASDSVTLSLVRGIFKGIPALNDWLRCRTRLGLLPNGNTIRLEKFAPMGSALCFPVECMVFSLIVQLANRLNHVDTYFRVYGDDIIVHRSIYHTVVDILERLHFSVNYDKTFGPYSQFTESCGIECYQGTDVSPFRLPRNFDIVEVLGRRKDSVPSPGRVTGAIELCNSLFESGLLSCRNYLLHEMVEVIPNLPFSDSLEFGLRTIESSNYRCKFRYNRDLQRIEHKVCVLVVTHSRVPDDVRYQLLLERYAQTTRTQLLYPSDRIELMAGDSHSHLRNKWRWLG